jgi:hypothetical protein
VNSLLFRLSISAETSCSLFSFRICRLNLIALCILRERRFFVFVSSIGPVIRYFLLSFTLARFLVIVPICCCHVDPSLYSGIANEPIGSGSFSRSTPSKSFACILLSPLIPPYRLLSVFVSELGYWIVFPLPYRYCESTSRTSSLSWFPLISLAL